MVFQLRQETLFLEGSEEDLDRLWLVTLFFGGINETGYLNPCQ